MALNSGSLVIRVALIVPLISLSILLHPEQSYACSCVTPGSPSEEMATSAAVFMGRVVTVREFERDDGLISSTDPTTIEFAVSTVWKGPSYETMFLTTARWDGSCGFTFVESENYVVYSRNGSTVSLCSRTRSLSEAQHDLAELGKGQAPLLGTIASHARLVRTKGRVRQRTGTSRYHRSHIGFLRALADLGHHRPDCVTCRRANDWRHVARSAKATL